MTNNRTNTEKKRVQIHYGDRCVHIPNDDALYAYLNKNPGAEYYLADHIRNTYRKHYGKELRITGKSLATEIRWHVIVYRWMKKMHVSRKHLDQRMKVIDCGEREIDNNRFVWDLLSGDRYRK